MDKSKQIIVCATQRSGSTMVCEDIASYGLGNPEERFLSWDGEIEKDWEQEFEKLLAACTTKNGVFSVKLMANQIKGVDESLSSFVETAAYDVPLEERSPLFPALKSAFGDGQWVWIRRRDIVDQAISHHFARKSGVYHVIKENDGFKPGSSVTSGGYSDKTEEVPYDFQAIMTECFKIDKENLKWGLFFQNMGLNPIEVWYEGYSGLLPKMLAKRLNVEAAEERAERNLVKMPSGKKQEMKQKFIRDLINQ